jgi:hypothetical protein
MTAVGATAVGAATAVARLVGVVLVMRFIRRRGHESRTIGAREGSARGAALKMAEYDEFLLTNGRGCARVSDA